MTRRIHGFFTHEVKRPEPGDNAQGGFPANEVKSPLSDVDRHSLAIRTSILTEIDPVSAQIDPVSTKIDPVSALIDPVSALIDPSSVKIAPIFDRDRSVNRTSKVGYSAFALDFGLWTSIFATRSPGQSPKHVMSFFGQANCPLCVITPHCAGDERS